MKCCIIFFFFFSSRRRHTRWNCDWSSDVCSSDLIIGGDPAHNWTHLMLGELWTGLVSGLRNPANALPQGKLDVLMNAMLLACDASDGIIDGIVEDPRTCNFDPSVTRCAAVDAP